MNKEEKDIITSLVGSAHKVTINREYLSKYFRSEDIPQLMKEVERECTNSKMTYKALDSQWIFEDKTDEMEEVAD